MEKSDMVFVHLVLLLTSVTVTLGYAYGIFSRIRDERRERRRIEKILNGDL